MFLSDTNKIYPVQAESRVKIRFQDCDPLQHLNNAKYFDYFFNAREDQETELYNFDASSIFEQFNSAWVAYHHQIAYLKPAYLGEWVRIVSKVIYFDKDTIVIEYFMTDDEKKNLKTVFWSTLKYVNGKTGQKESHQEVVMDFLKVITDPEIKFDEINFNDRIKIIKQGLTSI